MYRACGRCLFSALKRIRGTRPFVLTRSSYPSLGHYAAHWTGDISSNWDDLSYSIPGHNNNVIIILKISVIIIVIIGL